MKKHFRQTFCPASRSRCIFKNSDSCRHKVCDRMRSHAIAWQSGVESRTTRRIEFDCFHFHHRQAIEQAAAGVVPPGTAPRAPGNRIGDRHAATTWGGAAQPLVQSLLPPPSSSSSTMTRKPDGGAGGGSCHPAVPCDPPPSSLTSTSSSCHQRRHRSTDPPSTCSRSSRRSAGGSSIGSGSGCGGAAAAGWQLNLNKINCHC